MNLTIEWRVSPEHAELLPEQGQVPNQPIEAAIPNQHDVVVLADGRGWTVFARMWVPGAQGYKLVLWIEPIAGPQDTPGHTLH